MPEQAHTKLALIEHIKAQLDQKIEILQEEIKSAIEAQNDDTKSSAGDKFETSREMMQAEMDKNEGQLANLQKSVKALLSISPKTQHTTVEFGSIVVTNNGTYFISLGLGQISVNQTIYFAISLASPIGNSLHHKKMGDTITFQNRAITILDIQ